MEAVNTQLLFQSTNRQAMIHRLNMDNKEKAQQLDILRESLHRAEAIIKRFQLDVDKSQGANISLET